MKSVGTTRECLLRRARCPLEIKIGAISRPLVVMCQVGFLVIFIAVGSGKAQRQAQLTINMNVQSSIQLVFQNTANVGQTAFCPLINANTSNVGLDFGAYYSWQQTQQCASRSDGSNSDIFQSYFLVNVTAANTSSPNYSLKAKISSTPPAGVTWGINDQGNVTTLNTAGFQTIHAGVLWYNQPFQLALRVEVMRTVIDQTLQETVTFQATAN